MPKFRENLIHIQVQSTFLFHWKINAIKKKNPIGWNGGDIENSVMIIMTKLLVSCYVKLRIK